MVFLCHFYCYIRKAIDMNLFQTIFAVIFVALSLLGAYAILSFSWKCAKEFEWDPPIPLSQDSGSGEPDGGRAPFSARSATSSVVSGCHCPTEGGKSFSGSASPLRTTRLSSQPAPASSPMAAVLPAQSVPASGYMPQRTPEGSGRRNPYVSCP